ncbi:MULTISPECIES: hypothetical protein [Streptomyces]|uniref:hypothetical protein n=1 Tax=Streptomyces TaxID=1883 RepID=UPI0004CA0327|nr:hypothetical protein [Streptomyces sp. NRRL S-1868]
MITTTQIAEALRVYEEARQKRPGCCASTPVYAQGWPAGVLARYLTLGQAHADVIYEPSRGLRARCTACPWAYYEHFEVLGSDSPEEAAEKVVAHLPEVRGEAQEHAEVCRAVPVSHPEGVAA